MCKPLIFKTLFLLLPLGMLMFSSCSGDEKKAGTDEVVIDDDYYEYQDFNLKSSEINATIKLPDETANIGAATKPEVTHIEGDLYWTIQVGPNFEMVIEDYANFNDIIKEEKKKLQDSKKFFKVKYLIDEKDLIVYERVLIAGGDKKAASTVGVEHRTYHVCGQKVVDGITYRFASREEGFEKMIIEIMAKSIKSVKPNKAA